MQGSVKFGLPGEEEELIGPFEAEDLTDLHNMVGNTIRLGVIQGVVVNMMIDRNRTAAEHLEEAYTNLNGLHAMSYRVYVQDPDIEEAGLADISPTALGEYYFASWSDEQKKVARDHVQGDCGNPNCPIVGLIEAFHISDQVRSSAD
jgi:hypothetical protein